MNFDAKTLQQIQQQRAKLIASGELSQPRLLSEIINMDEATKRMKKTEKRKSKRTYVVI